MSRDLIGAALLGAGTWAVLAAGMLGLMPVTPRGHVWVVTASQKMSNRPALVRAAPPADAASPPRIDGGRGHVPES